MSYDTTFIQATTISSNWLNAVNTSIFDALGTGAGGTAPSSPSDVRTNLGFTASSGTSLIGFLQAGTGGVARVLQAKVREAQVSVKDFGAVGDGSTDDTANLQLAINAVCSGTATLKQTLFFPAGTYNFTGLTIPAAAASVSLVGEKLDGVILNYTPSTGNGIAFTNEVEGFTMKNINLQGASSGTAIVANVSAATPHRNHVYENVTISQFRIGYDLGGCQNWLITGGRWTGQGKGIASGYGARIGNSNACNLIRINNIYLSSYQTGIYNVSGAPIYFNDGVLGTCEYAIRNSSGKIYARAYLEDTLVAPDMTVVYGDGGYTWLVPNGPSQSATSLLVVDSSHRTYVSGIDNIVRCIARRDAAYSLNGGPTKIPFDTAEENDGSWFVAGASNNITIPFAGFYEIDALIEFDATADAQTLVVSVYKNAALMTQTSRGAMASAAGQLGVTISRKAWLAAGDVIDIRAATSANLGLRNAVFSVFNAT